MHIETSTKSNLSPLFSIWFTSPLNEILVQSYSFISSSSHPSNNDYSEVSIHMRVYYFHARFYIFPIDVYSQSIYFLFKNIQNSVLYILLHHFTFSIAFEVCHISKTYIYFLIFHRCIKFCYMSKPLSTSQMEFFIFKVF